MEDTAEKQTRLGIEDKRTLFQSLLAMVERLLFLNKFPVDIDDFAQSLHSPEIEAAWKVLRGDPITIKSTSPNASAHFNYKGIGFLLHVNPDSTSYNIFMDGPEHSDINLARRHKEAVSEWCTRQIRLEEQILRSAKVIKAIVHSCNTVGQYKRVSPDLLTFLPNKYREALRDYAKQSPYPAITVEPQEIDTTLSTLAYAALQPTHTSEEIYISTPKWGHYTYDLARFPRTVGYSDQEVRSLNL